ncbi:hypothetical protein [Thiolapillus sp.]|uniref:hypothetical protein n=1 Tax=Thiolapillus sp. TaxID=2017437 RepID=UPI003AF8BFDE
MKNETEKKYYIVELRWTGPDQTGAKYVDYDRYEITTAAPRNTSGNIQLSGWMGRDGFVARYAHGEYVTLTAADYAVVGLLEGEFRRYDGCRFHGYGAVVAMYRPGKYPPMCDGFLEECVLMAAKNNVVSIPREFTSWDQVKLVVRDLRDAFNRDGYDAPASRIGDALMRVIDAPIK